MSERKSPPSRGSLMDLAKPRLAHSPLAAPVEEAERLILSSAAAATMPVAEPVAALVRSEPPARDWETPGADWLVKLRKVREPIAVAGFKLPARLKEELAAVAQHNRVDMTKLVVEALERLLPALPHPPGWEK